VKKDARIPGRVTKETKERWQEEAMKTGYSNLWAFIEEAVEKWHFPDEDEGAPAVIRSANVIISAIRDKVDVPAVTVNDLFVTKDTPQVPVVIKREWQAKVCENERFHRRGIFCKQCKKVIK
jgi:hypothetical protein